VAERGKLERLVIRAHEKPDYSDKPVREFVAYVNPSEVTLGYEIEYDAAQGAGTTASRMEFKRLKPGDMTLTFFLDGTGASGQPLDVQRKVKEFQEVTTYNGKIHRTNYLVVAWGTLTIKRCVLKSASIAYKLFQPSGVPLRAVITATFLDNSDDQTRVAIAGDQSPDLTHVRLVKAGDSLPRLCAEIYGDALLYLKVAEANGLDDFRNLRPGTRVRFPPLRS
jgi:hypothetical protein